MQLMLTNAVVTQIWLSYLFRHQQFPFLVSKQMKTNRRIVNEIEQSVTTDFPASCLRTVFIVMPCLNLRRQTIPDHGMKYGTVCLCVSGLKSGNAYCHSVQNLLSFSLLSESLTFWRRNYFLNFSTPCIKNVNNIGTKYVRIMKQTAF